MISARRFPAPPPKLPGVVLRLCNSLLSEERNDAIPKKESFHFNKIGWENIAVSFWSLSKGGCICATLNFSPLTTAGWICWPSSPSSCIGYYSSWWIHLGDLLLECKALRSGQMENALHGAWHAVSPRNVFRYVHRQWDKAVPLSHSCCWNFLLVTCFCISNVYLQWNIGVSCIYYVLKCNKLKSQLCSNFD